MRFALVIAGAYAALSMFALNAKAEASAADLCERLSSYSKALMTARQNGASKSDLIDVANDNLSDFPRIAKEVRSIVDWAFDIPVYSKKAEKERVAIMFSSLVSERCEP